MDAHAQAHAQAQAQAHAQACKFCGASDGVVDCMCDRCEARWLEEVSYVAPECEDDTPIADLFRRTDASLWARDERTKLLALSEGGPVPVYLYGFGQDVRYILLGEFAVGEGGGRGHRMAICTLDNGKGGMRRAGLHGIVAHDPGSRTPASLRAADAAAIVASAASFLGARRAKDEPELLRAAAEFCG